ncbi:MAG: hypothetical protein GF334_09665, partial [Candidatus Altiarchaeales archaeon]|nr:hypothetical protein [Candidatus Altiarchaeales archaeon]
LITAFLAMIAFIYWPPLQWIFHTSPLTVNEWLISVLVASSVILTVEAEKKYRKHVNQ